MSTSEPVRVLHLYGSAEERGRALGEALADTPDGAERAVAQPLARLERAVVQALPTAGERARRGGATLLTNTVIAPLARGLSTRATAFLRGAASGLGAPPRDVASAALTGDALAVLAGAWPFARSSAARLACSSLVTLPATGAGGELLHARALERTPLPSDGPPLLCVHHPDHGRAHVSVHHGGGLVPGLTATNDAGLSVSVHGAHTTRVRAAGAAVLDVAMELIETCADLAAARALLRARPTAGGWLFVVSDARRGRAVVLEHDRDGPAPLYPPGDFLAASGALRTRKERHAFAPSGAWRELEWSRLARLNAHAREARGAHTPATLLAALACERDAYEPGRRRPFGNVIAQPDTVDQAVLAPGLDGVWLATGDGPRAVPTGYAGLSLSALFAGRTSAVPAPRAPTRDEALAGARADLVACEQALRDDETDSALAHLEHAGAALPDEPGLDLLRAACLLREGFALDARDLAERALPRETSPYRRGLLALLCGRALSQLGHRAEARAWYEKVSPLSGDVCEGLTRRAAKEPARDFSLSRASAVFIDPLRCDVLGP